MIDLSYPIKRPYNILCLIKKQFKILFQSITNSYYSVNYRPSSERFIRIFEDVRCIFTCDRKRKCLSDSFSHRNKLSTVYGALLLSLIVAQQLSFPLHCHVTSYTRARRSTGVQCRRRGRREKIDDTDSTGWQICYTDIELIVYFRPALLNVCMLIAL